MKLFQFRQMSRLAGGAVKEKEASVSKEKESKGETAESPPEVIQQVFTPVAGADASRTQIRYAPELSGFAKNPPVVPASGLAQVRFNKSSIDHTNKTAPSNEIRSDRMRSDLLLLSYAATGGFDSEWVSGNLDGPAKGTPPTDYSLIEAAMCGTWTVGPPAVLKNGVLFRSFLLEQGFTDIARYITYRGMAVEEWDVAVTAGAIIMNTLTFMGVAGAISNTPLAGTTLPPPTNAPITSGPAVSGLEANTIAPNVCVRSLAWKLKNNMRERTCVETYESGQFGFGVQDITGSMEVYFADPTAFQNMTAIPPAPFPLSFTITDPATGGFAYVITFPRLKIETTKQDITGVDTDVFQVINWRALYDSVTGCQMQLSRTAT